MAAFEKEKINPKTKIHHPKNMRFEGDTPTMTPKLEPPNISTKGHYIS
jgi:hypothetical protein